jgi:hypothetical protein
VQYRIRSALECIADSKADKTGFSKNFSAALSFEKLLLMGENKDSKSSNLILEDIKGRWQDIANKWINSIHVTNKPAMLEKINSVVGATPIERIFLTRLRIKLLDSINSDIKEQAAKSAVEVIQSIAAAKTEDPSQLIENAAVQVKLVEYGKADRNFNFNKGKNAVPSDYDWRPLAEEKLKKLLYAMPPEEKNRLLKVVKSSAEKLGTKAKRLPGADLGALCKEFDGVGVDVVADAVATQRSDKSGQGSSKETGSKSQGTAPTRPARTENGVGKDSSTRPVTGKRHPRPLSPAILAIEAFENKNRAGR